MYVEGNAISLFLEGDVDFAHGCNCLCKMKRGVALEVSERLPELYLADLKTIPGDRDKLGSFSFWDYPWGRGYNLYTQFTWNNTKDMLSYPAVRYAFRRMFLDMQRRGSTKVVIPKIGSGLAKGNWERIEDIILEETIEDIKVIVVNFKE